VDRSFKGIGNLLMEDGLKRKPILFALGIGGFDQPAAKYYKKMGWAVMGVPFYFKIVHVFKFLRNIVYLRRNFLQKFLLDLAAFSGIGWLGLKVLNVSKFRKTIKVEDSTSEMIDAFGKWADDLWKVSRNGYMFSAVRDSEALNILYPSSDQRFIRVRVFYGKDNVGWAVLLATQMEEHNYFGAMKLGSIVDCLSLPGFEEYVIEESTGILKALGVDLIVSNQSYRSWCRALRNCGYANGPSNFLFCTSPSLTDELEPVGKNFGLVHINRGDGGGPINL
jgi:hypothetical protein